VGGDLLKEAPTPTRINYTEVFYKQFPFYLSIGMSSAEYWDGDPSLPRYFREAFQKKQEYDDSMAWLHGMYVYNAMSVVMSNAFNSKGTKAEYLKEPLLSKPTVPKTDDKELKIKEAKAKAEVWMNQLVRIKKP